MSANPGSTSHPGHALRHMFNSKAMPVRPRHGYLFYCRCGLLYLNPADPSLASGRRVSGRESRVPSAIFTRLTVGT